MKLNEGPQLKFTFYLSKWQHFIKKEIRILGLININIKQYAAINI